MSYARFLTSAAALSISGCTQVAATLGTDSPPAVPAGPTGSVEQAAEGLTSRGPGGGGAMGPDGGFRDPAWVDDDSTRDIDGSGPRLFGPDGFLDSVPWEDGGLDGEEETDGGRCSSNEVQFRDGDTDRPRLTLNSFVFADDGESIWVVGFETLGQEDACEWATHPEQSAGYQLIIELSGDRADGTFLTWMDDDSTSNAAEVELENGGSGYAAAAEDDSGSLVLSALVPGQSLEVDAMTGTLDDGSYITDGSFSACYCGSMVSE